MSIQSAAIVSEVSLGYGTPQVLFLAKSIADRYGVRVTVYEPDQPERPALPGLGNERVTIHRVFTSVHPYSPSGRVEYCRVVADALNCDRPDLLIIVSFLGAPILPLLRIRPWATIFYALEHTNGQPSRELELIRRWRDSIDLYLFCDADRASLDGQRFGAKLEQTHVILNGSGQRFANRTPDDRNARFFYGGLLSPEHTHASYFLEPEARAYPIDLFGLFDGGMSELDFERDAEKYPNGARYGGYLSAAFEFGELLPRYAFSIVMWAPRDEATRFAAPNKFYEAIAAGVPPITTPHPQCQRVIERFRLGVLIRDWSFDAFRAALADADAIYQTSVYDELVENCLEAHARYLSWDRQFEILARRIDDAQAKGNARMWSGKPTSGVR